MADKVERGTLEYTFVGECYVRPLGRGIVLKTRDGGRYLEEIVPEGDYYINVQVHRLKREANDD